MHVSVQGESVTVVLVAPRFASVRLWLRVGCECESSEIVQV
jgi:hypothetical protein